MDMEDSEFNQGERIYLGRSRRQFNVRQHLARYYFAASQLPENSVVLDAASGSGYGSEVLSSVARHVIGLEINDHALGYAAGNHCNSKISYRKADLNRTLDLTDESVDAIVSFETLEHVSNQEGLISEFNRVLRGSGLLILSSPDRYVYSYLDGKANPYHVHELTKAEFLTLLSRWFVIEGLYGQSRWEGSRWPIIWKRLLQRWLPAVANWLKALKRKSRFWHTEVRGGADGNESHANSTRTVAEPILDDLVKLEPIAPKSRSNHYYLVAVAKKPTGLGCTKSEI